MISFGRRKLIFAKNLLINIILFKNFYRLRIKVNNTDVRNILINLCLIQCCESAPNQFIFFK